MKAIFLVLLFSCVSSAAVIFTGIRLLSAGDMSDAEVDSDPVDMRIMINGSIQAKWTGAPVGNIKLQFANTILNNCGLAPQNCCKLVPSGDWLDYTGTSQAVSGVGQFGWNLLDAGYSCLRLAYIKTSGTGSLAVTFSGKGR